MKQSGSPMLSAIKFVLVFLASVAVATIFSVLIMESRLNQSGGASFVQDIGNTIRRNNGQDDALETAGSLETNQATGSASNTSGSNDSPTVINNITRWVSQPLSTITDSTEQAVTTTLQSLADLFPDAEGGDIVYFDGNDWKLSEDLHFESGKIGIGKSGDEELIVDGDALIYQQLKVFGPESGNAVTIQPSGNTGYLSSSGGALYINNTNNDGLAFGLYSDAGASALGNMINVKIDNPEYSQAAFYMDYDGTSNAVEIKSNTNHRSGNALSVTNLNVLDSAVGVIGYELDRGTVKISHNGTGNDANASGLSIDLKGTGTAAQGIYVDSTATGGTSGKLLRLRNQGTDRFVVDRNGALQMGQNGTNTSITKYGNIAGDEFFVGITGAFRVQRSATDSEAFRTQVVGDTYGRWLGTADGKLKWSSGSADFDVVMERIGDNTLQLDGILRVVSPNTNSDVMSWMASDGSRLGRIVETGGGHGWFEIDDNTGAARIVLRADGGSSYINSGNFGIGTTNFGTSASKVLSLGNATAPTSSITDGIQLYAVDFDDGDGTATSELRVRDEDGNVTTLSPHNFSITEDQPQTDLDWSYYSERDGKAVNVNMAQLIREVEWLVGKQLLYVADTETGEQLRILGETTEAASAQDTEAIQQNPKEKEGTLTIAKGETVQRVELLQDFSIETKDDYTVQITPLYFIDGIYKVNKFDDYFELELKQAQDKDVSFDWEVSVK